jgi:hypothetical protein
MSFLFLLVVASIVAWSGIDLLALCGLDLAAFAQSREQSARAKQRTEYLSRGSEITMHRARAKEAIIVDLLAGRLCLLQAGRRFKDLNEQPITWQDNYHGRFPGRCDGEKICRQVLSWVEFDLEKLPTAEAQALRRRFEDELYQHMQRHGGLVVLPEG